MLKYWKRAKSCLFSTNLFWSSPKALITSASWNALCSPGKIFLDDGHAAVVGLGFEDGVGINLGGSSGNIDGGLTGLIFPWTMVDSKLAGQCRLHTTVTGDSGILSLGIAFLHLSFPAGSRGKRKQWLYSHHQNYHYSVLYNIFFPF